MIKMTTVPEVEATLKSIADLRKQAKDIDGLPKIAKMVEQMGKTIWDAWQAGRFN
jgi:hypothetical protein